MTHFSSSSSKESKKKSFKRDRLFAVQFFLFGLSFVIIFQLFRIQVLNHNLYAAKAGKQHNVSRDIQANRGSIYFQEFKSAKIYPLAINRNLFLLFAVPAEIDQSEKTADALALITGIAEETILTLLQEKDDPYVPIKYVLSKEEKQEIEELNLSGIHFEEYQERYYPEANLTSHLTGFMGYKDKEKERRGQYGIEEFSDIELRGVSGLMNTEKDVLGRPIGLGHRIFQEPQDGADIILTTDRTIQFIACQKLTKYVKKYQAESGLVIIMSPEDGAIISLCIWPNYNPNQYQNEKDFSVFINKAISESYEPGSIFKPITMAAGLDLKKVKPITVYNDPGSLKIGKYTIHNSDFKAHGDQTMIDVLDKSLNTGAIFVNKKIGHKKFAQYVNKFGFGELTGIELAGETIGDISAVDKNAEIYQATSSFGQGITVTPIQIVTAFTAIANDGLLLKPYLIKEIRYNEKEKKVFEKISVRQVIKPGTARALSAMLLSSVENGYAKKAGVSGYQIAGKTGTAQIPKKDGSGYSEETIHSFVGFGPVENPLFVMLTRLDKVKNVRFSSDSAAPLFGEIAEFLLEYWEIAPFSTK